MDFTKLEKISDNKILPKKTKKIMLLGMSPLPFENDRKVYGTGIRTWQFVEPLLKQGHKLCVCCYAIPSAYDNSFESIFRKDFQINVTQIIGSTGNKEMPAHLKGDNLKGNNFIKEISLPGFEYNILNKDDFDKLDTLKRIYSEFKPDCIIGCSFYPSYIAARLAGLDEIRKSGSVPFWADLFGHVMAEAQARAFIDEDDSCLFHYWNSEYAIITTADFFSCVSKRQEYALAGELGAVGRLNRHTAGYDFSCAIPCGMPGELFRHGKNVIRGFDGIEEKDFVILWTGGYNTWTDVDTLFDALEIVFGKNPSIKFVSTGGEIPEQDNKTYPRFLSMIESSRFNNNFIMRGWVPGNDVPGYYLEADIGINIDKDIYEVRLGSKNRLLDWMRAGLCILSSNVCELTEIIEREKLGYTFKAGDSKGLAETILSLADTREEVRNTGKRGQQYGLKNFNYTVTTEKLQEWASDPGYSPDKGKRPVFSFDREEALKNLQAITHRQALMISERDSRISELEAILKKGFAYRMYAYLKILKRKISKSKKPVEQSENQAGQ